MVRQRPTILFRIGWIVALILVVAKIGLRTLVRFGFMLGGAILLRLLLAPLLELFADAIERARQAIRTGGVSILRASGARPAERSESDAYSVRALIRGGGISALRAPGVGSPRGAI
jgi:hypothetical protein